MFAPARVVLPRWELPSVKRGAEAARLSIARPPPRCSRSARWTASRRLAFRCQQFGLMLRHQRVNDLAQRLALDDLRQLIEREIDAMIAHPSLRIIVGAD